jgi:hypothetical protein
MKETGNAIICGSIMFQGWPKMESDRKRALQSPMALDSCSWTNSIQRRERKKPHRILALAPTFVPRFQ